MWRPRERVEPYSAGGGPVDNQPPARPVDGIPWLTNRERDFLAHLTTLTVARQTPHGYDAVSDALAELADDGQVLLRADDANVYVLIAGRVIVHAARDWLRWASTVRTN
jgi:hypothetical protein